MFIYYGFILDITLLLSAFWCVSAPNVRSNFPYWTPHASQVCSQLQKGRAAPLLESFFARCFLGYLGLQQWTQLVCIKTYSNHSPSVMPLLQMSDWQNPGAWKLSAASLGKIFHQLSCLSGKSDWAARDLVTLGYFASGNNKISQK